MPEWLLRELLLAAEIGSLQRSRVSLARPRSPAFRIFIGLAALFDPRGARGLLG